MNSADIEKDKTEKVTDVIRDNAKELTDAQAEQVTGGGGTMYFKTVYAHQSKPNPATDNVTQ